MKSGAIKLDELALGWRHSILALFFQKLAKVTMKVAKATKNAAIEIILVFTNGSIDKIKSPLF
ncbi:hypothetical protein PGRAN_11258 [Listeria grandensis FSL F6-0971]|uniref:Uncharacterized protein n=1 Tax=Listeria grandensis FSL F6-0971 TaxID=1265819 RepID=W7B6Q2_9LIST|nr:hypothetical protein [Listeria grandensis]EUJ22969.1 hypothetical protein PGRAN_11258 [Listeria grandensis FSL F6-0971]